MAAIGNLAKLFKAIAAQDWPEAQGIALELAAAEERIGHHEAAQLLRGALHPNGHRDTQKPSPFARVDQPLSDALTSVSAISGLDHVVLRPTPRAELATIVDEWRRRSCLEKRKLRRRTKLLFFGPPGCGKSLTARALAHDLSLPVFVVRFDAIVGAYLGQTALRIRELFRFVASTPCVLLIDEVDALAKRRGNPLDVGELDRVVISLMQELEHTEPMGLLVAASNVPRQLDEAFWRRFDLVLEFPRPTKRELATFASTEAHARDIQPTKALRQRIAEVASFADAEKVLDSEARRLALKEA